MAVADANSFCKITEYFEEKFFEEALSKGLGCRNVRIIRLKFSMGAEGGDYFSSWLYRVEALYSVEDSTAKKISLICKMCNVGDKVGFEVNSFTKEKRMYVGILPKLHQILRDVKFAPQCFHTVDEPAATFILEDMKASHYSLADRSVGLDENHCRVVLEKLAQFHAASILLIDSNPVIKETRELQGGLFSSLDLKVKRHEKFVRQNLNFLIEHTKTWQGYEEVTEKLIKLDVHKLLNRLADALQISPDNVVVLNHGDMWTNNFLFKYCKLQQTPVDAVLIDFQNSAFGSPGIDVNYFLASSPRLDVLENKKDYLIEEVYYREFKSTLEKNGCEYIPSLQIIRNEVRKNMVFGFVCCIGFFPILLMNKEESINNSLKSFANPNALKSAISTERYLDMMRFWLKENDQYGLFNN